MGSVAEAQWWRKRIKIYPIIIVQDLNCFYIGHVSKINHRLRRGIKMMASEVTNQSSKWAMWTFEVLYWKDIYGYAFNVNFKPWHVDKGRTVEWPVEFRTIYVYGCKGIGHSLTLIIPASVYNDLNFFFFCCLVNPLGMASNEQDDYLLSCCQSLTFQFHILMPIRLLSCHFLSSSGSPAGILSGKFIEFAVLGWDNLPIKSLHQLYPRIL